MIAQSKNTIENQQLQEMLNAAGSSIHGGRATRGLCQYETPDELAKHILTRLDRRGYPHTVYDPQCFRGNLLDSGGFGVHKFGIELDRKLKGWMDDVHRVIGDCVSLTRKLLTLYPDIRFERSVCNPPFSLQWDGKDSTLWTWEHVQCVSNGGAFIGNENTLTRLGISSHPWTYDTEVRDFPGISVKVMIVYWENPNPLPITPIDKLREAWHTLEEIAAEDLRGIPPFNIWVDRGVIRAYLSTFEKQTRKLKRTEIADLISLDGKRPETLAIEKTVRALLRNLIDTKFYTISPDAERMLESAMKNAEMMAVPLMKPTEFSMIAWAGEQDKLHCISSRYGFVAGQSYDVSSGVYDFTDMFTRKRQHIDEDTGRSYTKEHKITLSGCGGQVTVANHHNRVFHHFRERGHKFDNEHPDTELFEIFRKPEVKTIRDLHPERFDEMIRLLKEVEEVGGFNYKPGQDTYIARMAIKDFGYICAETGVGKTLMLISLLALKPWERALVVAPQGILKSEDEHSPAQWIEELDTFAPYLTVHELFSKEDYYRLKESGGGTLPPGVYISYYEAMFTTGAMEVLPPNLKRKQFLESYGLSCPKEDAGKEPYELFEPGDTDKNGNKIKIPPVGAERNGIRCIVTPSLSTLVGDAFDFIGFDEAHTIKNPKGITGSTAIRLQSKYRYAFSATPIPNNVRDLFGICGWLAVPGWHAGGICNAVWPYRREDVNEFVKDFQCKERDHTQEAMNRAKDEKWTGACVKHSPRISNPATLIKITAPFMGYINKEQCNPLYRKPVIRDIRVPMSCEQQSVYDKFLDLENIPGEDARIRKGTQIQWLRGITSTPHEHGVPLFTPKVIAVMQMITQFLEAGEQVLHISARISFNDMIQSLLDDAGISYTRIDSTMPPRFHSVQRAKFKAKVVPIQLMGIKCAQGHSYPLCRNNIISSLEWTNGALEQALGRTDRINSESICHAYVVLHGNSIEDHIFDTVMTKDDAAKIVLKGQRVPKEFKPVDLGEIVANARDFEKNGDSIPAKDCEFEWFAIRERLRSIAHRFAA